MSTCEIFRFYKLITTKSLIEPISMIVPRRVRGRWGSAGRREPFPRRLPPEPGAHVRGSNREAGGHFLKGQAFPWSVRHPGS